MDTFNTYKTRTKSTPNKDIFTAVESRVKAHLPTIARFLLVVTFLEDSIRITTQWKDQNYFLKKYRGFPYHSSEVFLVLNVITMMACSLLAVMKKHTSYACAGLFGVVISQAIGYGLIFNTNFVLRTLSVCGGLFMLLAETMAASDRSTRSKTIFTTPLQLSENDRAMYVQLIGRILLVFLFANFLLSHEMTLTRGAIALVSVIGCAMIVVGFKAKWSAWFLIVFLFVSNFLINNWWSLNHKHPRRDFQKYDFFQTFSIVGGFLLLINMGPGGLSVDEKKKIF